MKYPHVLMAFASEPWAMEPGKLMAIVDLIAMQCEGIKFSAGEIEAKIAPAQAKATARREGSVLVLPMRGVIANRMPLATDVSGGGGTSAEGSAKAVKAAREDDAIKAVIVDADSPGGNVLGIDELAEEIRLTAEVKPIIAHVNGSAASACYWAISGASEIVLSPSAAVGSIGVYTVHQNLAEKFAKDGVAHDIIGAGRFKAETNSFGPLTEEARAAIQESVDAYYGMFVDRVAKGRNTTSAAVRGGFGEGRMVMARAAVAGGMADRIATLDETLVRFGVGSTGKPGGGGTRAFAPNRELRALDF